ncbi:MAG: mismatch-specific DNA-glycosylase [Candidatus Binataceae bacterium]
MRVRDIIVERPRILLVGINPGMDSGRLGHHFAGRRNPFWKLLAASRLIPVPLTAADEHRLAEFGIAMTNVCDRATASASELRKDEIERGMARLKRKIRRLKPEVVAFVGLDIYRNFFRYKVSGGAGAKPEIFAGARIFALPNPSGINANFPSFAAKLIWFERLREFVAGGDDDA